MVFLFFGFFVLYRAGKAPSSARSLQWRGMTVSSMFSYAPFMLGVIIAIAVVVTCIFGK
jgi:hypothetical protein